MSTVDQVLNFFKSLLFTTPKERFFEILEKKGHFEEKDYEEFTDILNSGRDPNTIGGSKNYRDIFYLCDTENPSPRLLRQLLEHGTDARARGRETPPLEKLLETAFKVLDKRPNKEKEEKYLESAKLFAEFGAVQDPEDFKHIRSILEHHENHPNKVALENKTASENFIQKLKNAIREGVKIFTNGNKNQTSIP